MFSAASWDAPQAEDYVASIVRRLALAAAEPTRLRKSAIPPYRILSCRSHRAYIRIMDGGLFVVRILHTSMNEAGHLP